MTFIEFFDKTASENICACLAYLPERVVFIGGNAKPMKKHIENYSKVFSDRGEKTEFIYKTVQKSRLDKAVALLSEIVETYDDCVFDITGGEELLMLALGMVYAKYPEKNIQIHKFNLQNNAVYDYDMDGKPVLKQIPKLSVEENIKIYGGEVVYEGKNGNKTYKWDMTDDFLKDIDSLWSVCKKNVRRWNTQINIFEAMEAVGDCSDDGLTVVAKKEKLKNKPSADIISSLLKKGLITSFESNNTVLAVTYKNKQVKKCLTKAGLALEMKVYKAAKSAEEEGKLVYNDALNGVVIDWDGQLQGEESGKSVDVENEIDVMLMHDMMPIFISCKNGRVTADELYKLNTVAERFGGKYAKKVLVATALDALGGAGEYLRQRAKDMKISIIENVQKLSDEELEQRIANLWKS